MSSPVVLNNETRCVRCRVCGGLVMDKHARESSWGTRTWQVRLRWRASARGDSEATGYRKTEDRDGCVLVLAR